MKNTEKYSKIIFKNDKIIHIISILWVFHKNELPKTTIMLDIID